MLILKASNKTSETLIQISKQGLILSTEQNQFTLNTNSTTNKYFSFQFDNTKLVAIKTINKISKANYQYSNEFELINLNSIKLIYNTNKANISIYSNSNSINNYKLPNEINDMVIFQIKSNKLFVYSNSINNKLNEAIAVYAKSATFTPIWVALNANDTPEFKLEMIESIHSGVKKSDWKAFIKYLESTEKEFENILPASISSMQKKSVYSPETSERIYELAKLFNLGYTVFDTKNNFKQWLKTPSKVLANKQPFELLNSSFGFEIVENEINRIKYNVYA